MLRHWNCILFDRCFQWQHYMTGNTVQNLSINLTPLLILLDFIGCCLHCWTQSIVALHVVQTWSHGSYGFWIQMLFQKSKSVICLDTLEEMVALVSIAVRVFHICKSLAAVVQLSCKAYAMIHLEKENFIFLALDWLLCGFCVYSIKEKCFVLKLLINFEIALP